MRAAHASSSSSLVCHSSLCVHSEVRVCFRFSSTSCSRPCSSNQWHVLVECACVRPNHKSCTSFRDSLRLKVTCSKSVSPIFVSQLLSQLLFRSFCAHSIFFPVRLIPRDEFLVFLEQRRSCGHRIFPRFHLVLLCHELFSDHCVLFLLASPYVVLRLWFLSTCSAHVTRQPLCLEQSIASTNPAHVYCSQLSPLPLRELSGSQQVQRRCFVNFFRCIFLRSFRVIMLRLAFLKASLKSWLNFLSSPQMSEMFRCLSV